MDEMNWDEGLAGCAGTRIYPSQAADIEGVLADLKKRCPADLVLLVTTSGHVIATQGRSAEVQLAELGSLIAGDLSASQEIARLTGQFSRYQMAMREGQKTVSFMAEAGDELILFVQLSREIPLGWARLAIEDAGKKIGEIMRNPPPAGQEQDSQGQGLDQDRFLAAASDSFDSMWNG